MDYHEQLYAIYGNWVHGRITKRSAIIEFENVMKQNGLFPFDMMIEPNLSDEMFLSLLNQAFSLTTNSLGWLKQQTRKTQTDIVPDSAIVPSAKLKCPVCRGDFSYLFNEINIREQEDNPAIPPVFKLNPPRCETCAREWLDINIFKIKSAKTSGLSDSTPVTPLNQDERVFFLPYEKQLKEPDKR